MRKPKQILDKRLQAFYIIFDEKIPDKSIAFIIGAMKQYAEEYHRAELLKLNKSDVISSVCNHTWEPYYDKGYRKCTNCGMELGMPLQTDL